MYPSSSRAFKYSGCVASDGMDNTFSTYRWNRNCNRTLERIEYWTGLNVDFIYHVNRPIRLILHSLFPWLTDKQNHEQRINDRKISAVESFFDETPLRILSLLLG